MLNGGRTTPEREDGGDGTGRDADGSGRGDAEGGVEAAPDGDPTPASELYVVDAVVDLPGNLDRTAFAVTAEGVFRYSARDGNWQPIRYGSRAAPVPAVTARSAVVGDSPTSRPLISNGDRTVYVDPESGSVEGSGTRDDPVATVQEAVQRAPIYLRDRYLVDLATVPETPVSYDEDVLVPSIVATGQAGQEADAEEPGPFINFEIRGEEGNAGAVDVGSLTFGNLVGTAAGNLLHARLSRESPYDDEGYGLSAYGDGEVKLYNVEFTDGPSNGVLCYGARMKASRVDFGEGNLAIGCKAKRHASVIVHDSRGTLNSDAFRASGNSTISIVNDTAVSGHPMFNTLRGGLIYEADDDEWIGLAGNTNVSTDSGSQPEGGTLGTYADHPTETTPGDVWYLDGSGEPAEGFYGQTASGPVKMG